MYIVYIVYTYTYMYATFVTSPTEHRFSWEANSLLSSKGIPFLFMEPDASSQNLKERPLSLINHNSPVHNVAPNFFMIYFNIILPLTPAS
jgi:hypothetical protein